MPLQLYVVSGLRQSKRLDHLLEEIDDEVCGAATPDTSEGARYCLDYLKCKATKEKRFCKTKEQCETEGSCSSHWGPQLKEEFLSEFNYQEACTPFVNICITPMDMTSNPGMPGPHLRREPQRVQHHLHHLQFHRTFDHGDGVSMLGPETRTRDSRQVRRLSRHVRV